jgi:phosphocarrier protein HPr
MNDGRGGASTGLVRRRTVIVNVRGLHARAAASLAKAADRFVAETTVSAGGQTVSARSIMGLLMLAASKGTEIEIAGEGCDAEAAIETLVRLVERGFDEKDPPSG